MVFSSLLFTFLFLPILLLLHYLVKGELRNYILLFASLVFYSYGEPHFVFIMLLSIIVNYVIALWIDRNTGAGKPSFAKILLLMDVLFNLGILFIFKYLDFTDSIINRIFRTNIPAFHIALPIGISFFTFQALSYVIDVYRGTTPIQKNPFYLALYISFFPQLVAGPIVRYSTIETQITSRTCTKPLFAEGCRRFLLGFCKKILLANNLSVVAAYVFAQNYAQTSASLLWLGSICYSLQIFYDFSGYSDMAIGLGKLFGFTFEENFNYPYIATSGTEFWRRWHISLSQWFRDYVYIPLGGSKVRVERHILNLFVVWLLTGIWHGANLTFIVWGLGYFVLLVIEKFFVKPEKRANRILRIFWRIFTLFWVNLSWVMFNSSSLKSGVKYIISMFGFYGNSFAPDPLCMRYVREYGIFLVTGILFSTPIMLTLSRWADKSENAGRIKAILAPTTYGILFLWAVSFLILGAHNPFIYFNF